jgi:hypothetical protein
MKRRSKVGRKGATAQGPKPAKIKPGAALKSAPRRPPAADGEAAELARLIRELKDAQEQQSATSEVLHAISTAPGELDDVIQTIVTKATRPTRHRKQPDVWKLRHNAHWWSLLLFQGGHGG